MTKAKKAGKGGTAGAGRVKAGASVASAPTTGDAVAQTVAQTVAGVDLAALHRDPAMVTRAGIACGMSADEIDRRLIAAAAAVQP